MRRQSFRGARFVARTLVTCLVGCAPQPVEHPISTVRDSAGIRIVENAPPAVSNEVWSVDTVPVLRIGQVNGMPEHQLYRVGPLARLSDGTVVVALVSELRFYAADGTWMQTVGRQGGGPGEYEEIGMLRRLRGDSLLVWDGGQRRVTVLGPDGSFGRDALISRGSETPVDIVTAFEDGRLVIARRVNFPKGPSNYLRDTLSFTLQFAEGRTTSVPLPRLSGQEWQVRSSGSGGIGIMLLPFSRNAFAAAGASHVYMAESDGYEIRAYTPGGSITQIVRLPTAPRPVTGPLLDSLADYWHMKAEAEAAARGYTLPRRTPEQYREETRQFALVPTLPAFDALIVEDVGNLWVRDFDPPWRANAVSSRWTVFAPDGSLRTRVTMPVGLDVRCIEGGVVLGIVTDSLGVEYVQGHRLRTE